VIIGMTGLSIYGSMALMPPASYLPRGNRNSVYVRMSTPPGYSVAQMSEIGRRVESYMAPWIEAGQQDEPDPTQLPKLRQVNRATGEEEEIDVPPVWGFLFISRSGSEAFAVMQSSDQDNIEPVVALASSAVTEIPGVSGRAFQSSLFRTARRGSGSGIELELVGQDMNELAFAATSLRQELAPIFGGANNVRPSPADYDLPGQEVRVVRKPVEASDLGLGQQDIIDATQVLGDGAMAGEYIYYGDIIDMRVRAKGFRPGDATYLSDAPIVSPVGRVVPLSNVAEVRRTVSQESISRVEKQRSIALQISITQELPVEAAMVVIEEVIARQRAAGLIPPTVRHELAGVAAKLNEVKASLLGDWHGWSRESLTSLATSRLFLALLVVFLLMAALFEDWLYPVVIMFSVPLATVGGFIGLAIMQRYVPSQQLDILSMLGFVILVGVVVNNAILIVHQTLNLMRGAATIEGMVGIGADGELAPGDAISLAVKTRVRPIFMSMLTSVGGMAPLALFPGAGSELYRGLGSVVVGGLVVSTVFTLLLVPLMLSVMFDLKRYARASARYVVGLKRRGGVVSE
jgi:HAE1 family hydrophobic/amphiphilic exporter-1